MIKFKKILHEQPQNNDYMYFQHTLKENSLNNIVEDIKNQLLDSEGIDNWEEFVNNQKIGDCQGIVSDIKRMNIPEVECFFGELEIQEPKDENDFNKKMTHHWVEIAGEPFEFSKGTLKDYVEWIDIYGVEDEGEIEYINKIEFIKEEKINKYKIKILSNPQEPFHAPLNTILKKLCGLRTAEKEGDIEIINSTQLGKLKDQKINFEILPLNEEKIADIEKEIEINVALDKSDHAKYRQSRDPEFFISDNEIIEIVQKAIPRIAKLMVLDVIFMNSFVHVFNIADNVNIIGYLKRTEHEKVKFVVVTVMKKENFKVRPKNGKQIYTIKV